MKKLEVINIEAHNITGVKLEEEVEAEEKTAAAVSMKGKRR